MKGMTPINITVDDKENSHKRCFLEQCGYTTTKLRFLAKNIMGASILKSYRISSASRIFNCRMQLIKLPRKTKAHCNNKGNGELKDIYIAKIPLQIRELPYRSLTLDSVASILWVAWMLLKKMI
jgi:hypothetical protein